MPYSKLVGGAIITLFVLIAGSTITLACGAGFMQALLFQNYPEAKSASMAISKARIQGTLKGAEWHRTSGMSLHAWRTKNVLVTVKALEDRLNSAMPPSAQLVGTNLFLLNEFAWLAITTDGNRVTVSRRPLGSPITGASIFTSRRVLDNVFDGIITWQKAVDLGLIRSRCNDNCLVQTSELAN